MSKIGAAAIFDDVTGEILSQIVGSKAFKTTAVDGVGITVNSTTGALEIQTGGSARENGIRRDEMSKYAGFWIKGDLVASDAAAGIMSVQNTYGTDLVIDRLIHQITTDTTGACTADFGVNAAAVSDDDLMDNVTLNATTPATPIKDNITEAGTNGRSRQKWASGDYVTGSMATGATAGLVGTYAIHAIDMN